MDELVSVVQNLLVMDGEAALQEEVVMDLTQPGLEVRVAGRAWLLTAGEADQGSTGRPESESNSRAFVQEMFSGVVGAC